MALGASAIPKAAKFHCLAAAGWWAIFAGGAGGYSVAFILYSGAQFLNCKQGSNALIKKSQGIFL